MKKVAALGLCLLMVVCAASAMAAGSVNIAIYGQDGFEDYISNMLVAEDRLLLSSWDGLYTWTPGDETITAVTGYQELDAQLYESCQISEGGERAVYTVGDTQIELEDGQRLSLRSEILPVGDRFYRQAVAYGSQGDTQSFFVELIIAEDGAMSLGEVLDMEDAMLYSLSESYTSVRDLMMPCDDDGLVYALSYGGSGMELVCLDLESASFEVMDLYIDYEVSSIAPFTQGKLLMVANDYTVDPIKTVLLTYDLDAQEANELGELPSKNVSSPCAVVYDEARSRIYYALAGSVWRMDVSESGLGKAQEFADMPLEVYSDSMGVLLGDWYILCSYQGVVGRNVTNEALPQRRLNVENFSYLESIRQAYFPFTEAHPEYMVSVSNGGAADTILQDMMNRSADVDIYTLEMQAGEYAALLSRGFMAELTQSEILAGTVSGMYESIAGACMRDGEICALPLDMYSHTYAINKALLTSKLGYSEADIPTTWPQLFALLGDLADSGKLEAYPEVSLLSPGYTLSDARVNFFTMMLSDYFLWMDHQDGAGSKDSGLLLDCCLAFEAIDWEAFGLPQTYEEESFMMYDAQNILFETTSVQPGMYLLEEGYEPLILAIAQDEPRMMGWQISAAFVNPFSENREAAIEYLEMACALMDETMRICMMPQENEPVKSAYYEEQLDYYDEHIAQLEAQLAQEVTETQRDRIMLELENAREYRQDYEENGRWRVSVADIERYREYAQMGVPAGDLVWTGGTTAQLSQYLDGAITAQQLCAELEKTLRMQRLEGN